MRPPRVTGSEPIFGGERQHFVGLLQQRCRPQAKRRPQRHALRHRKSQRGGMGELARFIQRRVSVEKSLIEISEARKQP